MVRVVSDVVCGDCRVEIPKLGRNFDFVFADPPFNIGQQYDGYNDSRTDYKEFTDQWIDACWDACGGVLAIHGPDDLVELYLAVARRRLMKRIAWVNWHYRFGQCSRSNWIDARCHCLIFAKHDDWTWNPESVLVESDRVQYGDKRVNETENGGKRLPGTVWGIPSDGPYWGRVQGNNTERRRGHPNQLPEVYLERLIRAYTNPGDWVLDPFAGSGTTAVVASALGRNCVTIDVSKVNCDSVVRRVAFGSVRVKENEDAPVAEET